jgi:ABC-type iron transport system FetAB ATPase subunit
MLERVTDPNILAQLNQSQPQYERVTDPAILAQLNGQPNPSSIPGMQNVASPAGKTSLGDTLHGLNQAGRAVGASYLNLGQGLLNFPGNVVNQLGQHGFISPQTTQKLQGYFPTNPQDFNQQMGVEPTLQNKLLGGMTQYAPYLTGANAIAGAGAPVLERMAAQGLGGMGYGATQNANPVQGANQGILAAPLEGATSAARSALTPIASGVRNLMSRFAFPAMSDAVNQLSNFGSNISNKAAFLMAKENHDQNYLPQEDTLWKKLDQYKTQADQIPNAVFDNTKHQHNMEQHFNDVDENLKHNPDSIQNQDAQKLAYNSWNAPTSTFTDAINHNKVLNSSYRDAITPGSTIPLSSVKYAIKSIKGTLTDNLQDLKNSDDPNVSHFATNFENTINQANESTANRNKLFHEVTTPSGDSGKSTFSNINSNMRSFTNQDGSISDSVGNFVNDYIPSSKNDGIGKMQQFSQMVGDSDYAKSVLKKNIFNNQYEPKSFLDQYDKLSKQQQEFLFSSGENDQIRAMQKMIKNNPNVLSTSAFQKMVTHAIPFLLTGLAAHGAAKEGGNVLTGEILPPLIEAGTALALAKPAGSVLKSKYAFGSRPVQQHYINSLMNPNGQTFGGMLGQSINPLAQGAIMPGRNRKQG